MIIRLRELARVELRFRGKVRFAERHTFRKSGWIGNSHLILLDLGRSNSDVRSRPNCGHPWAPHSDVTEWQVLHIALCIIQYDSVPLIGSARNKLDIPEFDIAGVSDIGAPGRQDTKEELFWITLNIFRNHALCVLPLQRRWILWTSRLQRHPRGANEGRGSGGAHLSSCRRRHATRLTHRGRDEVSPTS